MECGWDANSAVFDQAKISRSWRTGMMSHPSENLTACTTFVAPNIFSNPIFLNLWIYVTRNELLEPVFLRLFPL
jgi:hypothetical protein